MKRTTVIIIATLFALLGFGRGYRWDVPVSGIESDGPQPRGYLWISPECDSVRAVMFAFQNMNEETLFTSERFRSRMAELGTALVWVAPGFGQEWDVRQEIQAPFDDMLKRLAIESGHGELATAPLIPFGHSAQATMPWNFAAWNPDRTLCIISYHGDAPRTNLCGYGRANVEWGRTRNIDGIPGLMVMGEYEWWDARLRPALAFRMMYPESCISFLGDAGRGHFDLADKTADYIALFIRKSMENRLSGNGLVKIKPYDDWLAESWHPGQTGREKAAPASTYKGCPHEAFWYFDEEMARLTEERYAETAGKKPCYIGFVRDGKMLGYNPQGHCKITETVTPDSGDTFTVKAVFTDSLRTTADTSRPTPITVKYVSGPATAVNDSTFRVDRNHPTWTDPRRRAKITLCAEAPSDSVYKETVQEIEITINQQ